MRCAGDGERARLHEDFAALCEISSPSGDERACADRIAAALRTIGLAVHEDEAGATVGSGAGNLFARIAGRGPDSVLLCAHMDTVPPRDAVAPVLVDGAWTNRNEAILGADNKAAVAVLLALARRLEDAPEAPEVGLELLFTISEETGMHGAKAFDPARLSSRFGYVFDHAAPIGEIVVASPTYHRLTAEISGRAAHAGLHPELGRSAVLAACNAIAAMELGRLDDQTTANIGTISGGTAANVVPEACRVEGEVRSLDDARVEQVTTELVDRLQDGADAGECDLDVTVEPIFKGYRLGARGAPVALAERALSACGYEPRRVASGGGSDANALRVAGFDCVNLANGTEHAHEPTERVSVEALEGMLEVAIQLHRGAGDER